MRIIDLYLLKNLVQTFFAVTVVFMLVTFGTESMKLFAAAVEGKVSSEIIFQLLMLKVPPALEVVMPLVSLITVIWTFGRLYQDQEIMVLNSCGVGPRYFQKIVLLFILPIALFTGWISLYIAPWSHQQERLLIIQASIESPLAGLQEGRFNDIGNNGGTFYAHKISPEGGLQDIWLQYRGESAQDSFILTAPKGQFFWQEERLALRLENGWRYQGFDNLAQSDYQIQRFESFEGILPEITPPQSYQKRRELTSEYLWHSDNPKEQAQLQWRIMAPIGVLVLALLGLKLSKVSPRQGRYHKIGWAILLYFIYNQMLYAGRSALGDGVIPSVLGLWVIALPFLIYALWQPREVKVKPSVQVVS